MGRICTKSSPARDDLSMIFGPFYNIFFHFLPQKKQQLSIFSIFALVEILHSTTPSHRTANIFWNFWGDLEITFSLFSDMSEFCSQQVSPMLSYDGTMVSVRDRLIKASIEFF